MFFWNHCLDFIFYLLKFIYLCVSILVFLEPLLRHPGQCGARAIDSQFQSLFFWNHCLDMKSVLWLETYNPVSILVFLEPLLRLSDVVLKRDALLGFQSLFFWNHCLDWSLRCQLRDWKKFQSLFFWNHCLDAPPRGSAVLLELVSILVFLEPLLRPSLTALKVSSSFLFQSLFFWNHCLDDIATLV